MGFGIYILFGFLPLSSSYFRRRIYLNTLKISLNMWQRTDRLFLRNKDSRWRAREWAHFIRAEVSKLQGVGVRVSSAYLEREDLSYRFTDPGYCMRRGVINIPNDSVSLDDIAAVSQCSVEEKPRKVKNWKKGVDFRLLIGKPINPNYLKISDSSDCEFEIHYQVGEFAKPQDGYTILEKIVDRYISPSFARLV